MGGLCLAGAWPQGCVADDRREGEVADLWRGRRGQVGSCLTGARLVMCPTGGPLAGRGYVWHVCAWLWPWERRLGWAVAGKELCPGGWLCPTRKEDDRLVPSWVVAGGDSPVADSSIRPYARPPDYETPRPIARCIPSALTNERGGGKTAWWKGSWPTRCARQRLVASLRSWLVYGSPTEKLTGEWEPDGEAGRLMGARQCSGKLAGGRLPSWKACSRPAWP
ncbi:hypothetical protein Dimus_003785 [Dionaea muscipula]